MVMDVGPPAAPVPPPAPAPRQPGPWPVVAAVLTGAWAVLVTVPGQVAGWVVDQVVLTAGLPRAVLAWPVVALASVLLVGAPTLALALLPRSPAVRVTGRAWLAGTLALGALTLLRTVPPVHEEAYLAALAAAAALLALVVGRLSRGRAEAPPAPLVARPGGPAASPEHGAAGPAGGPPGSAHAPPGGGGSAGGRRFDAVTLLAVAAGLAVLLPWAWVGALGGALETLLAALAAAALGALAAALLDAAFWARFAVGAPPRPVRLVLVGGLVAGVTLALLAAAAGQSGAQLPALFLLPPLGVVLGALEVAARRAGRPAGRRPVRWLVGLALLGPLAFTDPEEITVLLAASRDVPYWVAVGTGVAFAVAVLLAVGYGVLLARPRARAPRRGAAGLTAAALLAAVAVVYLVPGQPGLHGERLFVVLREQADLTGIPAAPGRAGRTARAAEVYRRLVATADRTQGDLRRELSRLRLHPTPYYLVNAIETDGGPEVRAWLSGRPEVGRVLVSQRLRPLPAAAPPARGNQPAPTGPAWNVSLIGADRVWSQLGVTGTGVVVGSSDSGVDGRHPALAAGFRGGDDSWYDPWEHRRTPGDRGGHGTHTVGSAVGRGGIGVAPGADWVACVNLDRNLGSPAHYLDCLQFMLAPFPPGGNPFTDGRPQRAPDVLTNSWGCPPIEGCDPGALRPATAALAAAGILVVAAAGNTGPHCGSVSDPPAPYPDVLTVGAVDRDRQLTRFSSQGPAAGGVAKPDLVAPGAGVLSAFPGGGWTTLDGTSMATPQVAGVVALMWSANPALVGDLARTRRILLDTAAPAGVPPDAARCGGPADEIGAGLVDAYAAVRAAQRARAAS
ncbi:S8 family serine peptidase [Micromonospora sp. DR5-3]|uniref:S8 family serine peptidase n=1 Tax=unclassified Micromonospora TaxID=2617518 RepID=UPI0011D9DFE6|nr:MULTISPECIES: S8 family serine peptidase [unclassified Micromonospora]MCW3812998.1 S8 family serine peptidase [Micromonospora sp. DR5-3]TYC26008.1 S8 family serine peptidase [Micromonospora sp. MP36]